MRNVEIDDGFDREWWQNVVEQGEENETVILTGSPPLSEEQIQAVLDEAMRNGYAHTCTNCGSTRGFISPLTEICDYCDAQFYAELTAMHEHA